MVEFEDVMFSEDQFRLVSNHYREKGGNSWLEDRVGILFRWRRKNDKRIDIPDIIIRYSVCNKGILTNVVNDISTCKATIGHSTLRLEWAFLLVEVYCLCNLYLTQL